MIKYLTGIHETADYRTDTTLQLYENVENEDYPPHWHTPFEIIMPEKGSYKVLCGNQSYLLREKDILIICPCVIHELFAIEEGKRIIFQPGFSQINIKELDLLISKITPAFLITPEKYPELHKHASKLLPEIRDQYVASDPYFESAIYFRFMELLVEVGRHFISTDEAAAGSEKKRFYFDKFMEITNYINDHFAEDLTLEEISQRAGFSKYHFSRLFKQYTDTSFYRYLNLQRITNAKTLLLDPQLSVLEVATLSGFASLSAFIRMFKQFNNCTPTEFRSMYTKHK